MNRQPAKYLPDRVHKYPYKRAYPWHYDLHHADIFQKYGYDKIPFDYYQYPQSYSRLQQSLDFKLDSISGNCDCKNGCNCNNTSSWTTILILVLIILFAFF